MKFSFIFAKYYVLHIFSRNDTIHSFIYLWREYMADLNREMIAYLTKLSRINCTESEQDAILKDLKKILDYAEQLNEVDTDKVPPCLHVLEGMVNVMREDVVGETMPRELFLANAPSHVGGMIRVPPIIKQ